MRRRAFTLWLDIYFSLKDLKTVPPKQSCAIGFDSKT